jgi:alpha-maltose-1-phosphate synthase
VNILDQAVTLATNEDHVAAARTTEAEPLSRRRRLRVLVIAELANPDWVSIPLVGWSHWHALSKLVDGHLVTHVRNQENILKAGLDPQRLTTLDDAVIERPVHRITKFLRGGHGGLTTATALGAFSYYYFEHALWRELGEQICARHWDIVHRLTPLSPVMPSLIAARCARHGVPFVIGPLNGGLPWPKGFEYARLAEREWLSYVREAYKLLPGYRSMRRTAAAIITGSSDTRAQISARYRDKTVYVPENAVDPARFTREKTAPAAPPLKVAFVGRFTLYKGADMLLEAAAPFVRAGAMKLDMIGDGEQKEALQAQAAREGLPASIFSGWIKSHAEVQQRLASADLLGFPSIREFGGGVVLEAMALGVVPIVVDYGGPAELVSAGTGVKLPLAPREQIVQALRAAFERFIANPGEIQLMGARARARVFRLFTWDAKAAQVFEVYRWVLKERSRPDFGMPMPDPPA